MIRVMSLRDQIRLVSKHWDRQYGAKHWDDGKRAIGKALAALDLETASAEDIARIIGNNSWVGQKCDQCGNSLERWVQIGEEPDYDARYANLCGDCLRSALKAMAE